VAHVFKIGLCVN